MEYLARYPSTLSKISTPGLPLSDDARVDLAEHLFGLGLLPEGTRATFVKTVVEYAIDGQDGYALENDMFRRMAREEEWSDLLDRIRHELLPHLHNARRGFEDGYSTDLHPDDQMQPFFELLSGIEKQFGHEPGVAEAVAEQSRLASEWAKNAPMEGDHDPGDDDSYRWRGSSQRTSASQISRCVFEDIDS